ncbi:hypothetical protein OROGR_026232 [Orobanche gracilis]
MSSYYVFLLTFITLTFTHTCVAQTRLISYICSKSRNSDTCFRALMSDPRSSHGDIKILGEIIIEKSQAATQAAINVTKSVENNDNKEIIETCIETQNDAKDMLKECLVLLEKASYDEPSKSSLNNAASAALTYVGTCDDEFGSSEPPKLKRASRYAQDLIDVLLVISKII